jgi:3-(3-hydroxy-phenyl)propionate hydroxylase
MVTAPPVQATVQAHAQAAPSADRPFVAYPFDAKRYPAALPVLQGGVDALRRPVVVVGGGPVGLCTAIGIATHGVPVVLLEADDGVCVGSRAICISRRSLEIVERLGAVEAFQKHGLPWTGGRSFYRGDEVLHFTMPSDANQKHPPMLNLAQYVIEQNLLDRAEQLKVMIDIRWQTTLTRVETSNDSVKLHVTTPEGDYAIDADYVVAADGGRSFVREQLGLKLQGTSYEGRYVIVDVLLDSPRPTERLAYFDPPCNPGSTVLVHKQPHNVWRIDYQLQDGEDATTAIEPRNVLPRVESLLAMMGETAPWQPIWMGLYKANALTLDSYRAGHGRVLFAGDAAHLLPIFGVRGANSGIDDADNLAWKLAFVCKGLASDKLLDSYSSERVAAARENMRHGTKSTEFMAPPSLAFDLMRTAALSLAVRNPEVRSLINPRQSTAIAYGESPLNAANPPSATSATAGPHPGQVLPECPITVVHGARTRQGHITDLVAPQFTALYFQAAQGGDDTPQALMDWASSMHARGIPFGVVCLTHQAPTAAQGSVRGMARAWDHTGRLWPLYGLADAANASAEGTLLLLRPDGHVLGRWSPVDVGAAKVALHRALS